MHPPAGQPPPGRHQSDLLRHPVEGPVITHRTRHAASAILLAPAGAETVSPRPVGTGRG